MPAIIMITLKFNLLLITKGLFSNMMVCLLYVMMSSISYVLIQIKKMTLEELIVLANLVLALYLLTFSLRI